MTYYRSDRGTISDVVVLLSLKGIKGVKDEYTVKTSEGILILFLEAV